MLQGRGGEAHLRGVLAADVQVQMRSGVEMTLLEDLLKIKADLDKINADLVYLKGVLKAECVRRGLLP